MASTPTARYRYSSKKKVARARANSNCEWKTRNATTNDEHKQQWHQIKKKSHTFDDSILWCAVSALFFLCRQCRHSLFAPFNGVHLICKSWFRLWNIQFHAEEAKKKASERSGTQEKNVYWQFIRKNWSNFRFEFYVWLQYSDAAHFKRNSVTTQQPSKVPYCKMLAKVAFFYRIPFAWMRWYKYIFIWCTLNGVEGASIKCTSERAFLGGLTHTQTKIAKWKMYVTMFAGKSLSRFKEIDTPYTDANKAKKTKWPNTNGIHIRRNNDFNRHRIIWKHYTWRAKKYSKHTYLWCGIELAQKRSKLLLWPSRTCVLEFVELQTLATPWQTKCVCALVLYRNSFILRHFLHVNNANIAKFAYKVSIEQKSTLVVSFLLDRSLRIVSTKKYFPFFPFCSHLLLNSLYLLLLAQKPAQPNSTNEEGKRNSEPNWIHVEKSFSPTQQQKPAKIFRWKTLQNDENGITASTNYKKKSVFLPFAWLREFFFLPVARRCRFFLIIRTYILIIKFSIWVCS